MRYVITICYSFLNIKSHNYLDWKSFTNSGSVRNRKKLLYTRSVFVSLCLWKSEIRKLFDGDPKRPALYKSNGSYFPQPLTPMTTMNIVLYSTGRIFLTYVLELNLVDLFVIFQKA